MTEGLKTTPVREGQILGRTPTALRRHENEPDWRLPTLAAKYPRCSTDRETAEKGNLEWVTPGHSLFEASRRHAAGLAREVFTEGACFYSLQHAAPVRIDFYRARVVDGLGNTIHEKMLAVELADGGMFTLREPGVLGDFTPAPVPEDLPTVALLPEPQEWLHQNALTVFLDETRKEREAEVARVAAHVELSLTELLQKTDEEIGRAADEVEKKVVGAEGRMAQAEARHAELMARRERRRQELDRERSLTLQGVERLTSVLVLPHPERETAEVRRLQPNPETEDAAMRAVMAFEEGQGRQVYDVHEKNLGYDITSLDLRSGDLRLIEVKGLSTGADSRSSPVPLARGLEGSALLA